jgi:NAD-dependent SIR2 family protein deacetylase
MKKKLVVLSGAGISAESGISTFRDSNGLWENHRIEDVASPEGFARNPKLVLDFYNLRRRQLKDVKPNLAHEILAELEQDFDVYIITQNVDDLHERAGSKNVIHLHGELKKVRSVKIQPKFTIGKKIVIWVIAMNWETNFVRILFGLAKWFLKWIMLLKLLQKLIFSSLLALLCKCILLLV